mmetsp:Transcript_95205/g.226678  ORF Transcript_95205/g.226678 Transcript_95205/m.226678 type:complete len:397 (-) Transcript_95205:1778-2968(-)
MVRMNHIHHEILESQVGTFSRLRLLGAGDTRNHVCRTTPCGAQLLHQILHRPRWSYPHDAPHILATAFQPPEGVKKRGDGFAMTSIHDEEVASTLQVLVPLHHTADRLPLMLHELRRRLQVPPQLRPLRARSRRTRRTRRTRRPNELDAFHHPLLQDPQKHGVAHLEVGGRGGAQRWHQLGHQDQEPVDQPVPVIGRQLIRHQPPLQRRSWQLDAGVLLPQKRDPAQANCVRKRTGQAQSPLSRIGGHPSTCALERLFEGSVVLQQPLPVCGLVAPPGGWSRWDRDFQALLDQVFPLAPVQHPGIAKLGVLSAGQEGRLRFLALRPCHRDGLCSLLLGELTEQVSGRPRWLLHDHLILRTPQAQQNQELPLPLPTRLHRNRSNRRSQHACIQLQTH